jgi:hypothetical protein
MSKHHSPNDQRSIEKNPNNPAYQAMLDNRSQQIDPQNAKYNGSPEKPKAEGQK